MNTWEYGFYIAVKVTCYAYIIYKVWGWNKKIREVCGLLYTPKTKSEEKSKVSPEKVSASDVIGGTHFVYLDENAGQTVAPVLSEPLGTDQEDIPEEDKQISSDEVEYSLSMDKLKLLGEEQTSLDALPRSAEAFTETVSVSDLSLAGDVLMGVDGTDRDEEKGLRAARTLRHIRGTDLFDIFVSQMENAEAVNALIDRYLDENGMPRAQKTQRKANLPIENWRSLI